MRRILFVLYGTLAYLLFLASFVYFIGFLSGLGVPKSVDSGAPPGRPLEAVAWDVGLLAIFFTHHSVMARAGAKRVLTRVIPPVLERSTYVLVASLALGLVFWQWRPLPQVVWQAHGLARLAVLAGFWIGVVVALVAAYTIDGLELFGLRQVLVKLRGLAPKGAAFATPGLYRLVRHPLMTGILLALWCAPTMSAGRLLLTAAMSAYIWVAVKLLEERDLRKTFGTEYERYQREVPMVVPYKGVRRSRRAARASS
ncbi:MAG TPA: NnrU family protein [Polyangia bacterium]|jgi:protein-S-isoprenylcysteine O-methyltransferase Ste14